MKLPKTVLLGAIQYRIQEHEGLISFKVDGGFFGVHSQFTFQRENVPGGGCWYLSIQNTFGKAMVSHIVKAYDLICKTYGGNFEIKP